MRHAESRNNVLHAEVSPLLHQGCWGRRGRSIAWGSMDQSKG